MIPSKTLGTIRAPQLVGMYGPGSIVNLEKLSVMPSGVGAWDPWSPEISAPTFAQEIRAQKLIDTASLTRAGVPVSLFPRTYVCRKCGTVQQRRDIGENDLQFGFLCEIDRGPLYPSRWVVFCQEGHIDDFDYRRFVHSGRTCDRRRVVLETGASLAETFVVCECGAKKPMSEAYRMKGTEARCGGYEPWTSDRRECSAQPKLSMRSASDVYFGAVRSAITIEPESNPSVASAFGLLGSAASSVKTDRSRAREWLKSTSAFEAATDEELDFVLDAFFKAQESPHEYRDRRYQEFQSLTRDIGSPREDLYVESVSPGALTDYGISGLCAVRKLREVRALVGFKRGGMPADPAFDEEASGSDTIASLGRPGIFPAYENRGEGIFVTLDSVRLKEWLARPEVRMRVHAFKSAELKWRTTTAAGAGRDRGLFVLAHTFAHLLIRQVSLVCGYSQSSLRERIYASPDDEKTPWAGVLVYTASSDADGSLGGLVAQANEPDLQAIVSAAFDSLQLCSSDPICALQVPVGFRKMNAAACHGCVVLPETCCERNNAFLDRTFVVPHTVHDHSDRLCYFP